MQNRIPAKEAFVSFSKLSPVLSTYMKTFKIEFKCFRHLGKSLKDLKCGALSSANFRALISLRIIEAFLVKKRYISRLQIFKVVLFICAQIYICLRNNKPTSDHLNLFHVQQLLVAK